MPQYGEGHDCKVAFTVNRNELLLATSDVLNAAIGNMNRCVLRIAREGEVVAPGGWASSFEKPFTGDREFRSGTTLTLSASGAQGSSEVNVELDAESREFEMGFNVLYLREFLFIAKGETVTFVSVPGISLRPARLIDDANPDLAYVLMPMQVC